MKLHVADSRHKLVARQVTRVVPSVKSAPDGGLQVTVAPPVQLPVVVGAA